MDEVKLSDAMRLLKDMWEGELRVKPFSEPRLRFAMHDVLALAVKAGLQFDKGDFSKLYENFHLGRGYYATGYLSADEHYYSLAVATQNTSACQAFEHTKNRKPFIINNVDTAYVHFAGHHNQRRPRSRLSCGCKFSWNGEQVAVTSFSKDGTYLTACSYKPLEHDERGFQKGTLKVKHIYKLTHKDIKGV